MKAMKKNEMRALVLKGVNEYAVETVPIPVPGAGEVLCAVEAVAICGSDPSVVRGEQAGVFPPSFPFIPGHEWAGTVVEVGEGVSGLKKGDRVAGEAHSGCGYCVNCKMGRYNDCLNYGKPETGHRHYGFCSYGAYAQYGVFMRKSLTPLPANVSFPEAAMMDAAGTALNVIQKAGITPGGTVAVIGPGPIGMVVTKLAKALGSSRAIMIGRGERLRKAREMGSDVLIDFEKEDVIKTVMELTAGIGADEVYECAGKQGTLNQAIQIVKKTGNIGVIGMPPMGNVEKIDNRKMILNEVTVFGSRANPNVTHKLVAMVSAGRLIVKDVITHHFSLENFEEALDCFVNRKDGALKVIIHPNGGVG